MLLSLLSPLSPLSLFTHQAQARECLHEKMCLGHSEDLETVVELAQEAAQVGEEYSQVSSVGWGWVGVRRGVSIDRWVMLEENGLIRKIRHFIFVCPVLSVYLSICLCVCLFILLSIYLSLHFCLSLSFYLSVCLSICLCICPPLYLCACLSVYLFACLFIYPSIQLFPKQQNQNTETYLVLPSTGVQDNLRCRGEGLCTCLLGQHGTHQGGVLPRLLPLPHG